MIIGIDARAVSNPQPGGFKTYSDNLIKSLLKLECDLKFHLFFDRLPPPNYLLNDKIHYSITRSHPKFVGAIIREQLILPSKVIIKKLDIFHSLCNTGPIFLNKPSIVTIHDVIQLKTPQILRGSLNQRFRSTMINIYSQKVIPQISKRASAVITVSNFEKQQIINTLNISPDRVFVTYIAASEIFTILTKDELYKAKTTLETEFNIFNPFILGVGSEPRKNINLLIEAYSNLGDSVINKYQLVIICANKEIAKDFQKKSKGLGLEDRIRVFTNINHEKLKLFYTSAEMLVFLSNRESFGLPPLEAMACGLPVISSDTSSLPEILGDAPLFVNINNKRDIVLAINELLNNYLMKNELINKGLDQSKLYSWDGTAKKTINVYNTICCL